ncbi:MAG: TetR/AcrR family transcriptional regulator [Clostridia bacterium]|nr:TetR/AcrR family transcriptional regulator [Clostridia bacterium]
MAELPEKPKTKRGEATREKLIQAAAKTFYDKGYHGSTIHDITRIAGVGSGTFYLYFDSKISVYRYLLIEYGERIRANSAIAIQKSKNRREAEELGIRSFFEFVTREPEIFNVIWESLYIDKRLFDDFYHTFSEAYVSQLEKAQKKGEVRDIDPSVLSYMLIGISNFVALNSIVLQQEQDLDALIREIMKLLDGGMFTS